MWHKKFNSEIEQWSTEFPKQKSYDNSNNQKISPIKLAEDMNKLMSYFEDYLLSLFISERMTLIGADKE